MLGFSERTMGWMSICEKEIKFAGKLFFFFFLGSSRAFIVSASVCLRLLFSNFNNHVLLKFLQAMGHRAKMRYIF
jgi:hypothetical protein